MTDDEWNPDRVRLSISRNLHTITTLYNHLPEEAAHHANNPELPGGDALHLHGPAANLQAWEHRYETNEAAGGPDYADDQIDTDLHPLLVLATWEDQLREARNQPTDLRARVDRAAAYIEHSINWMLDPNQHPQTGVWLPIDALNTDLKRVRRRLETVLHEGPQIDRGAPCLGDQCGGTPLTKHWGTSDDTDTWQCPKCRRRYDNASYKIAVLHASLTNAPALTATQLCALHSIKQATLRKWAERGDVTKHGKDGSGRMLYNVQDALEMRDREHLQTDAKPVTMNAETYTQNGVGLSHSPAEGAR